MMATEFWPFSKLLYEKDAGGHRNMAHSNIRTLPFTSSGTLPKYIQQPSFISRSFPTPSCRKSLATTNLLSVSMDLSDFTL